MEHVLHEIVETAKALRNRLEAVDPDLTASETWTALDDLVDSASADLARAQAGDL